VLLAVPETYELLVGPLHVAAPPVRAGKSTLRSSRPVRDDQHSSNSIDKSARPVPRGRLPSGGHDVMMEQDLSRDRLVPRAAAPARPDGGRCFRLGR
jgi:hypothetical protein